MVDDGPILALEFNACDHLSISVNGAAETHNAMEIIHVKPAEVVVGNLLKCFEELRQILLPCTLEGSVDLAETLIDTEMVNGMTGEIKIVQEFDSYQPLDLQEDPSLCEGRLPLHEVFRRNPYRACYSPYNH